MKENIKYCVITFITGLIMIFTGHYLTEQHTGINKTIVEHKVINTYRESYQSIYGTYYKYFVVTEDGTFKVSDTEYYEITNTGVYKQWKTSN